jgi:hypothetical protein
MRGTTGYKGYGSVLLEADVTILHNAPVGIDPATGYARNFTAGDLFAGFAYGSYDSTGQAAAAVAAATCSGSKAVPVTSATAADVGSKVYCTAAGVYDLTSTTATEVGVVECCVGPYSAAKCLVAFKTYREV